MKKPKTFRELMGGHEMLEIVCPIKGEVVRRLKASDDHEVVSIDAGSVVISISADTEIYYEPWVFDRGNLLFELPAHHFDKGRYPGPLKIATEYDHVRYADGREERID